MDHITSGNRIKMIEEKQEVITFKVPESLKEAMRGIPNRSEFIRNAILSALDHVCPLCRGSGILTPEQKNHWNNFAKDHSVEECDQCRVMRLVCKHRRDLESHI